MALFGIFLMLPGLPLLIVEIISRRATTRNVNSGCDFDGFWRILDSGGLACQCFFVV